MNRRSELENMRRSLVMADPDQPCTALTNRQAADLIAELATDRMTLTREQLEALGGIYYTVNGRAESFREAANDPELKLTELADDYTQQADVLRVVLRHHVDEWAAEQQASTKAPLTDADHAWMGSLFGL